MYVVAMILALAAFSSDVAESRELKPPCNAQNRGKLWPEGIVRPGAEPLEICSQKVWIYRWKPLTIDASEWKKKAQTHSTSTAKTESIVKNRDREGAGSASNSTEPRP